VPLTVDGGPIVNGSSLGTINQGYVTVTLCVPGTSNCQNYDHIWVDTGSTGLRLFCSPFTGTLPPSQQNGSTLAGCQQFLTSYSWGVVRTADVKIGGEVARAMPIQVIGDTAVPTTAPSSCVTGTSNDSVSLMGANGLLGIGVFQQDCGPGCQVNSPAPPGFYYTCPSGNCQPVNVATTQQLQNVVGRFATDNNGTMIQMPALAGGQAPTATGSLTFGINTQSNNTLASTAQVVAADSSGLIGTSTTFGDLTEPMSFVDSGSNGWFFNDPTIPACSSPNQQWFCPASTVSRSATMMPTGSTTPSYTYTFNIANFASETGAASSEVGGPNGACNNNSNNPCSFDWGFPFFYGRSVFTALEGTMIGVNSGPFFAATP